MPCARATRAAAMFLSCLTISISAGDARQVSPVLDKTAEVVQQETEIWRRLKDGEVIVNSVDEGATRFVTAKILIDDTPHHVWRVLTNPFEFERKISPRMRDVEILVDATTRSVMKCKVDIFPPLIPFISYTVESEYKPFEQITFRRIDGSLKDFKGSWYLSSKENGASTEVTYQMYIDPGMPVPQWIIRKGIKAELPKTLLALRERIKTSDTANGTEPIRTILAVGEVLPLIQVNPPPPMSASARRSRPVEKTKPITVKPRQVSAASLGEY